MMEHKSSTLVVSALDEIAWLLNLRGSDISFNPVFFAYLIITLDSVTWVSAILSQSDSRSVFCKETFLWKSLQEKQTQFCYNAYDYIIKKIQPECQRLRR